MEKAFHFWCCPCCQPVERGSGELTIQNCIEKFVEEEEINGDDQWYGVCPIGTIVLGQDFRILASLGHDAVLQVQGLFPQFLVPRLCFLLTLLLRYCSKCKDFRDARKKFDLWKMPPILIIHFKRFKHTARGRRQKIEDYVHFPLRKLDLQPYVRSPQREGRNHPHFLH